MLKNLCCCEISQRDVRCKTRLEFGGWTIVFMDTLSMVMLAKYVAVFSSSQWTGWVPGYCSGDGDRAASIFTVSSLRICLMQCSAEAICGSPAALNSLSAGIGSSSKTADTRFWALPVFTHIVVRCLEMNGCIGADIILQLPCALIENPTSSPTEVSVV